MVGVAAPEGITLGVLSPLQHKLLSLEGGMLVTHPAEEETEVERGRGKSQGHCFRGFKMLVLFFPPGGVLHLRSALHLEGPHSLKAEFHHIAALGGELMAAALEALLVEDNDLPGKLGENTLICESDTMHKYCK